MYSTFSNFLIIFFPNFIFFFFFFFFFKQKTAYEMYQFWLNTPDADVVRFLRYFTFLPPERIAELEATTRAAPEKREAQRVLACEVTALVHGEPAMRKAEAVSAARFGGDPAVAADLRDPQATV